MSSLESIVNCGEDAAKIGYIIFKCNATFIVALGLLCRWRYGCIYATSTLNGLAFDNTTQAKRRPWPSMVVGECVSPVKKPTAAE